MDNQMQKLNKWVLVAGLAGGALMTAMLGSASAAPTTETTESTSASGTEQSRLTHITATITAIDHSERTVTLKSEEGNEETISVPSDAKVFDKLKVGEKVDIDYYQSMAVSMAPSGSKPSMTERRGRAVDMGGGVRGREVTMTAEVVSVDPSANVVTFKGPKGNLRTVHVQNPTLQEKLQSLKPGQVVQFDYTQATAASIKPSK
jgi:cold shock CspA family protein